MSSLLLLASCKLEPCKDYRCVNGLPLEDGKNCICLCDLGWEGVDCTIEDKCVTNQVVCFNGGYCNSSGICVCLTGYEGDSCQLLSRNRFLEDTQPSLWSAKDTCGAQVYQYVAEMRPGTDNRTLELYNIRDVGSAQFITVIANKQALEQRTNVVLGGVEIRSLRGTLSVDSSVVRLSYVSIEGLSTNCKGSWSRQ